MARIDRRQLGKRLAGSVAGAMLAPRAIADTGAFAQVEAAAPAWTQVFPGIWKTTIGQPEAITPVSSRLVPPFAAALAAMSSPGAAPLPPPTGSVGPRGTYLQLPLASQEEIYGFGLQFFMHQHRRRKRTIRNNADPRGDSGDSHAPVPFYLTSKGYGVLVDTARYAAFYCGEVLARPDRDAAQNPSSPRYHEYLDLDQASQVTVEIPHARGVDVYLFAGPTPLDAVRRYNLFSGGGVNPPEWGLGFWYRASGQAVASDVTALAAEFRASNIPCDVIGLEPGWQSKSYSCSFVWNKQRFPGPAGFIQQMHAQNFRLNLWEHAFTHPSSPLFLPLHGLSADKAVWGGLVPDFQDPRARQVFGDYHGENLINQGIDGFKLDECDGSDYTGGWSFADYTRFPSGVDGEQMHSLFGLRYQRTLWEQFQQRNKPTYNLVRSSGALASPYPFVLYSDLYDHRQFIRALVNSGFSGLLWCPEVRDAKSEEDLIRRLQSVVFSPLAMINGWYIMNPPWKQIDREKNNAGNFTPGWQTLEARCREIIGWRMQLIPYLRAAFALYALDGTPPFRALALDWPDVPDMAKIDDAWMIGDRLLVAPLFAGEPGRALTLPPGDWHDYWTGAAIAGSTTLNIPATRNNIPVYIKSGSVMPLATIANSTADPAGRRLHVRIFGDGQLPFEMHDALKLAWDGKTGHIQQQGSDPYTVASWSPAIS